MIHKHSSKNDKLMFIISFIHYSLFYIKISCTKNNNLFWYSKRHEYSALNRFQTINSMSHRATQRDINQITRDKVFITSGMKLSCSSFSTSAFDSSVFSHTEFFAVYLNHVYKYKHSTQV